MLYSLFPSVRTWALNGNTGVHTHLNMHDMVIGQCVGSCNNDRSEDVARFMEP